MKKQQTEVEKNAILPSSHFEPEITEGTLLERYTLVGLDVRVLDPTVYGLDYYFFLNGIAHPCIVSPLGLIHHNNSHSIVIEDFTPIADATLTLGEKISVFADITAGVNFLLMKNIEIPEFTPGFINVSQFKIGKLFLTKEEPLDRDLWTYPGADKSQVERILYTLGLLMYYVFTAEDPYSSFLHQNSKWTILEKIVTDHMRPIIPWEFECSNPKTVDLIRQLLSFKVLSLNSLIDGLNKLK